MFKKSRTTPKKNNPLRRIWSKSIPDFFGFFVFLEVFGCPSVFSVFREVFWCPQPQLPKKLRKTKKNKSNNPVRRICGKSISDCFFVLFFSRFFGVPSPQLSKKSRKTQKNNPVRRIWGKSIPDCFFVFLVFLEVFAFPNLFFHTLMLPISLSTCRQKFGDDLGFFTCPSCLCGFGQWNALWNTLELCSSGHSKTKCFLLPRNGASADS